MLDSKFAYAGHPFTYQIGSWSTHAAPAIFTAQTRTLYLSHALAALAATQRRPFILLAPSTRLLTAPAMAFLTNIGAAFFPLDTTVILTDHGTLLPAKTPGELFSQFTPQPSDIDLATAQKAHAFAKALNFEYPLILPTPFSVFDRYFVRGHTANQIAHDFSCSKATILNRLKLICRRTGLTTANLHRLAPYFATMDNSLSDPRARHIHPKNLFDNDAQDH